MRTSEALERIIIVPRNGYANRLQAWASAAVMGAELGVSAHVLWEPEQIAPTAASDLFSETQLERSFITLGEFHDLVGFTHGELPRYLTWMPEAGLLILAGHDRGEQRFMPDVAQRLRLGDVRTLVLIAGGQFQLEPHASFNRQREVFYTRLEWHAALNARVTQVMSGRPPYVALHIRQTDRSVEAPTTRSVREALSRLRESTPHRSLFIAADTEGARGQWAAAARKLGLRPWTSGEITFEREVTTSGIDAIVDWILLAHSEAMVHPAASTFSTEAAVASGHPDRAIALAASSRRQRARRLTIVGRDAIAYPKRHWLK